MSIVDVHVILRRGGRILLGRRANTRFGDGMLHLPSGHLEAGESVTTAAIREAAEEIGVAIDPADLRFAHVMHRAADGGPDRVGFFFVVDRWTGEPINNEPEECSELVWVDPAALPSDVIAYPAAGIRAALAESAYGEFGWAGLAYGTVTVVDHLPEWSAAGRALSARLSAALGPMAVAVEHVGSTAVPGLPAKPILDIAVGLAPGTDTGSVIDKLTDSGLIFRGDKGADGGLLFVAESLPMIRTAHVHVVAYADPQFGRYVAVRDRLRGDTDAVKRYSVLKRELAVRHPDDRSAYTRGKALFLEELTGRGDGAAPG